MKNHFSTCVRRYCDRAFTERQILIRSGGTVRSVRLSSKAQAALLTLTLGAGTWLGAASIGFISFSYKQALDIQHGSDLNRAVNELTVELSRTLARLDSLQQDLAELEQDSEEKDIRIKELARSNTQLMDSLVAANRRLSSSPRDKDQTEQRNGRDRGEKLGREMGAPSTPKTALTLRSGEASKILQPQLAANDIALALRKTGLDVETMLRAARENKTGLGGPFIPAPLDQEPLEYKLNKTALQHVVQRLPLAQPMQSGTLMSGFGRRPDPFTSKPAMHTGIDLSAPTGTPVLATAPGQVVTAGNAGPYGRMVEIDHSLGLRTRYAHLRKINVRVGDKVELGQMVGIVGSSGRSTGAHLHYEVLYQDQALDPTNFIEAGYNVLSDDKN